MKFSVDLRTPKLVGRESGYEGDDETLAVPENARVQVLVRRVLMGDPHLLSVGLRVGSKSGLSTMSSSPILDFSYESACELLRGLSA